MIVNSTKHIYQTFLLQASLRVDTAVNDGPNSLITHSRGADAANAANAANAGYAGNTGRVAYLNNSGMAALHEGVYGEVVHAVLSYDLGGRLVRLERVQQDQRDVCAAVQKARAIAFDRFAARQNMFTQSFYAHQVRAKYIVDVLTLPHRCNEPVVTGQAPITH